MTKTFRLTLAVIMLAAAILACTLPGGSGQPSSPNEVETIVAATFQALTPAPGTEATSIPEPEAPALFPHTLYFMNNDGVGNAQVFRLERDGVTLTQVTAEPVAVKSYDVSPVDGSVAYVVNNQLLFVNADGSSRRVLADGGSVDPNNEFATSMSAPVFSPDGQTVAYGMNGVNLLAITSGASNLVLPTNPGDIAFGAPPEMYLPRAYSPDGTKIVVMVAIPNSDGISSGIYNIASGTLTRLSGGDGARLCCVAQAWTSDSSALYVGIPFLGMFGSGLWRVDAATGTLTTLLPTEAGGGNYNLADEPYLAPDGQLYFFFASLPAPDGFIDNAPLQIVRSAVDGVTGRTVLRPETFGTVNEALWAPDAGFVITAMSPVPSVYEGGALQLYYTDGSKSMVPLAPFGKQLKWGP